MNHPNVDPPSGNLQELVRILLESRLSTPRRFTVPSTAFPSTESEGYRIQKAISVELQRRGQQLAGYKISCTSAESMAPFGMTEPAYAALFKSSQFNTLREAQLAPLVKPLVEIELGFRFGETPKATARGEFSQESMFDAISDAFVTCEMADDRYPAPPTSLGIPVLLADDFMHAGFVVGEMRTDFGVADIEKPVARVRIDDMLLTEGAKQRMTPLASLQWLAAKLKSHDLELQPGHIVLTGSLVWPSEFRREASITLEIDGFAPLVS